MKVGFKSFTFCTWLVIGQVSAKSNENERCQAEGFDCTSNNHCCTEYCEKNSNDKVGTCKQACGVAYVSKTTGSSGKQTEHEEFPWAAEIYGKSHYRCTGTLISHTAVISAASCFVKEDTPSRRIYKEPISSLKVALGKYQIQSFKVNSVEFSPDFEASLYGTMDNLTAYESMEFHFTDEIAILTLKTEVNYKKDVRPVCIDIGLYSFEKSQISSGTIGKLQGCKEDKSYGVYKASIIPRDKCAEDLSSSYHSNLNVNHICIISINSGSCSFGEGLVFKDAITEKYYLRGINIKGFYTEPIIIKKLSAHKEMVEKYLDDCKRVCRRSCGISSLKIQKYANKNQTTLEEFPWNAGIYEYDEKLGTYALICGGTLISHKVVISAGYCFAMTKGTSMTGVKELSTLKVALGKNYRDLKASRDMSAQLVDVERIEYSPNYIHRDSNDIIFITLKTSVEYTKTVQPICIDFGPGNFEKEQLIEGAFGKTIGWNVKGNAESAAAVEKLKYGAYEDCVDFGYFHITKAIICAGDKTKYHDYHVCENYLGRGLVFEDLKTKTYYLRGVAAMNWHVCDSTRYLPFTTLSSQKELLEKYVYDCKQGCRRNLCEPLSSEKLHIICLLPNGRSTRCDRPMPVNSRAIFACNFISYMEIRRSEYNIINCVNGRWDQPLVDNFCVPAYAECGRPVSNSIQADVINGKETQYGDFPWHAGIYDYNAKHRSYEQICGGTLLSHKVVISAAHCFTVETHNSREITIKNYSTLKVGLGKYHRSLTASADVLAQIVEIQHIEIPQEYRSHIAQYAYDIAFITLKTQIQYTRAVRPVCVDVGPDNFENEQMTPGAKGKVVGWGLTEGRKPSEKLILAEMPFVPREECINKISSGLLGYLKTDKICAGDIHSNVTVCKGDSGGGLVFEDSKTKKYYLRGIVSLGPVKCKGPDFSLFTKLSTFKELLEKHLRL